VIADSFGNETQGASFTSDPLPEFGFQGMRLDATTLQDIAEARFYAAASATWLNQDPSGFGGGQTNTEEFAGNSPTNETDPTGLGFFGNQAYVKITTQAGQTYTPTTAGELVGALNAIKNAGDTISVLIIKAHGNTNVIELPGGGTLQMDNGKIKVESEASGSNNVTKVLQSVTGPNSKISFRGCFTYPLACGVDAALNNGTKVSGSMGFVVGIPFTAQAWGLYWTP
jgi:RHS repeat-associated protein